MGRSLFVFCILCICHCHGLDINLEKKTQSVNGGRNVCGVLTCLEVASSESDDGQKGLKIPLHNITSLAVFKRSSIISDTIQGNSDVSLGSVTSQNPRVLRVSNGRKVDGVLESERASLRLELFKRGDCQALYTCQVRGVDSQGRAIMHSASLVQQPVEKAEKIHGQGTSSTGMSLQLGMFLQQLVSQSVGNFEKNIVENLRYTATEQEKNFHERMNSLENRLEDKIHELQKDWITKNAEFEKRMEDMIRNLQVGAIPKTCSSEHPMEDSFGLFGSKLERIDIKLSLLKSEIKTDISNGLDTMSARLYGDQKDFLKNISESVQRAPTNSPSKLMSKDTGLGRLTAANQVNMMTLMNRTESILEALTSGEFVSQCVANGNITTSASASERKLPPMPLTCDRDMGKDANNSFPKYMMTPDFSLKRQVLCDTQTDGGGWVVIQRRAKGDVNFNRDWDSYKEGFGNLDSDGDFWLGNQAIHILTTVQPKELRIELKSGGKDYIALYKNFKVESESYKYLIRFGTVTSSIDNGKAGLSSSNSTAFSTFDRDSDRSSSTNCALSQKGGWWFTSCGHSRLNDYRKNGNIKYGWYNGRAWMDVTRSEMKIRTI